MEAARVVARVAGAMAEEVMVAVMVEATVVAMAAVIVTVERVNPDCWCWSLVWRRGAAASCAECVCRRRHCWLG